MSAFVSSSEVPEPLTLVYKLVQDCPIKVDVYPPIIISSQVSSASSSNLPAVVYFHGGALTVGNRTSWFPSWLHRRVVSSGIVFISADYRLIPPATGHDILADIKGLFAFLEHDVNGHIREHCPRERVFQVDTNALAVAGSSAGAMCAYLAAIHATPRPKAVLSLYGMGGDMLTWQYLTVKTEPFFRGREILHTADFSDFLYPAYRDLPSTSDSALAYHPTTHRIPGYPSNPRQLLGRLYLQLGVFLDYFTGAHEPSLSDALRNLLSADGRLVRDADPEGDDAKYANYIPAEHRHLFPQLNINSDLPPMFLIHGSADTAVFVRESKAMYARLENAGVRAELKILEGKEHNFDYEASAEQEFGQPGGLFEQAMDFLVGRLCRDTARIEK
ncbi:alpha/beta-hydrolase [Dichomitus squalens]|nr:alpha/beta-hydrolase [Dichomitus squalens]